MTLLTRRRVQELLAESGVSASRRLGQNFVVDPNTIRRIVSIASVGEGDPVLEIGPGLGSLTLGLAEAGARVVAVEKDEAVAAVARSVLPSSVELVVGDALEVDLARLARPVPGREWVLVANLPYNVATPVVLRVLDEVPAVTRLVVMVQLEVAERWVAGPGDAAYGIPSLRISQLATGRLMGRVSAEVFLPRPRVTSALVELRRRREPAVSPLDPDLMWLLVRTSFQQRRKTIRRSLVDLLEADDLEEAGVSPGLRPEVLGLAEFAALADAAARRRDGRS